MSFILDRHDRYTGFDALPENYTPDQAVEDGCFVVVGSNDDNVKSVLFGGGEHWQEFLEATGRGENASMRKVLFLDGTPFYTDLFYVDGRSVWTVLPDMLPIQTSHQNRCLEKASLY